MLDIKFIRENQSAVERNVRLRGYDVDIPHLMEIDKKRRGLIVQIEDLRRQSKELAEQTESQASLDTLRRERARQLKREIADRENEQREVQDEFDRLMSTVPNMLDARVPVGTEDDFVLLREWGEKPNFQFEPLPHDILGEQLGLLDIERGVRMSASRFYVLKNDAVRLRYAMIQLFQDAVAGKEWELVCPPFLAKDQTLFTAGYIPFAEKDNYKLANEDLSLIGTSEQAILGFHMEEIVSRLPLLYLGDSMCFRTEVGAAGRDINGILRVHQFYKMEQIVFCLPGDAEKWHLQCLDNEERFLQLLGIPYRVIISSSADLAAPGSLKYDIEAWMPSQRRYREVTSNTNLTDFQTRRGNIRFKTKDGRRIFPYTISATGFTDRHLLALMENNQTERSTIGIPSALRSYLGGLTEIVQRGVTS
jgi:seryl-tRNA synthetase